MRDIYVILIFKVVATKLLRSILVYFSLSTFFLRIFFLIQVTANRKPDWGRGQAGTNNSYLPPAEQGEKVAPTPSMVNTGPLPMLQHPRGRDWGGQ